MLQAGIHHRLMVSRISNHGLYLADDEGAEVLLPNRYVSLSNQVGDALEVFVYHDSEDRLVATTERPYATVGEVACLRAVGRNDHGAFLDWGLSAKDLFVPHRKQNLPMELGRNYAVLLYRDEVTGRAVATARLNEVLSNAEIALKPRQEVDILVVSESPIGFRVVVENRYWGMIYRNQLFRPMAVGERMKAYVRKITEDHRIDLSLQQEGFDEVKRAAQTLLQLIHAAGGTLAAGDASTPETVAALAGMSKKVFKRALGNLLKQGLITAEPERIVLTEKGGKLKIEN